MPDKPEPNEQASAILTTMIIGTVFIALGSAVLHTAITSGSLMSTLFAGGFLGIGLICAALISSSN